MIKTKFIAIMAILVVFTGTGFAAKTVKITPKMKEAAIAKSIKSAKNGSTIQFAAGTYKFKNPITIQGKTGITVKGAGQQETIFISLDTSKEIVSVNDSKKVNLQGFTAYHQVQPGYCEGSVVLVNNCTDIRISDCELNGCGTIGVWLEMTTGAVVEYCNIHNNSDAGLVINKSESIQINNNLIKDNAVGVIYIDWTLYKTETQNSTLDITMKDNILENNGEQSE